jgi:hypothetical protein
MVAWPQSRDDIAVERRVCPCDGAGEGNVEARRSRMVPWSQLGEAEVWLQHCGGAVEAARWCSAICCAGGAEAVEARGGAGARRDEETVASLWTQRSLRSVRRTVTRLAATSCSTRDRGGRRRRHEQGRKGRGMAAAAWRELPGAAATGPFIGGAARASRCGRRCLGIRTMMGYVARIGWRGVEAKSAGAGAGCAGSGGVRRMGHTLGLEGRGCHFGPREAAFGLTGHGVNGPVGAGAMLASLRGPSCGPRG